MAKKKQTGKPTIIAEPKGDCIIPPELPKGELHKLLFRHSEQEAQEIKDYVEWQAHGEEKVLHVEKVASERIFGRVSTMCGTCTPTRSVGGSLPGRRTSTLRP